MQNKRGQKGHKKKKREIKEEELVNRGEVQRENPKKKKGHEKEEVKE